MIHIRRHIIIFSITVILAGFFAPTVFAQGILPVPPPECRLVDEKTGKKVPPSPVVLSLKDKGAFDNFVGKSGSIDNARLQQSLGCGIKLGKIHLFMMPFYVTSLIQFLLTVAGAIAVLFVVIGGYKYVIGGITEDKESGKKTLTHALIGLLVSLGAWIIVNLIQTVLTS